MERSKDWMDEAESDLRHAKADCNSHFYNWACFSAQQAAEKAVKALLSRLGAEAWGHSVASLTQELPPNLAAPKELYEAALELDKAYIPTRYPNVHPASSPHKLYTQSEATRLIEYAKRIIEFCKSKLSEAK